MGQAFPEVDQGFPQTFRLGPTFFFSGIFGHRLFLRSALRGLPNKLLDPFLKLLGIYFSLVKGTAFDAVWKGQLGGQCDVMIRDGCAPVEGRLGACRFQDDQV
jgi:hypothetical protein